LLVLVQLSVLVPVQGPVQEQGQVQGQMQGQVPVRLSCSKKHPRNWHKTKHPAL
jgi:hypothetical protein